ncbi:DUF4297 domain-containing protein [Photobacterium phosphoreum]|uniref:DUF4297 domain-containing protein n=1 Tax=Photobacterium phosphoreum TaxID=659 RepID=UPI000D17B093|nr:DUF4297 domain-containing protein [Photobacterium phosphoreum]PSU71340.1 DUF4297 domain-containing protein [Photobacterium phosphoreum]PSW08078.1 DUF4297 domain-containing protein [Photobacterium phosphoreum]
MTDNPLAEAQRESAGASTSGKYGFQVHWALCAIIDKHSQKKEYAVFVEHHEDVVIANSLEVDAAQFEFYQVKNTGKAYTSGALTKRNKGANSTLKSSVLGKLLSSCIDTQYEDRITTIGLVSSSGFSLGIEKDLKLDVIKIGDIDSAELALLTKAIHKELNILLMPEHLHFIVPEIQLKNQEDYVVSRFAYLVNSLFPGSYSNPVEIYRAVIDEMGRLSRLEYDYKDWERLIEKKSLTSTSVQGVITLHSNYSGIDGLKSEFSDLVDELGWDSRRKRILKRDFGRIALTRAGFMSALDIEITNSFKLSYDKIDESTFSDDVSHISALEQQAMNDGLLAKVIDRDRLLLEVIYCLLKAN